MPVLQVIRLDNNAPGTVASGWAAPAQTPIGGLVVAMTAPWVNATTTLTPSATGSGTNTLGLRSLATLNAATTGTDVEEGVDAITVTVNVPAAGGTLLTTGGACNITGLTAVTTGNQLAAIAANQAFLASAAFGANAQACTGKVGNLLGADVPISFAMNAPVYHPTDGTIVQVDRDGVSVGATSSTTVTLSAVADVPVNTAVDPFSRVEFLPQHRWQPGEDPG